MEQLTTKRISMSFEEYDKDVQNGVAQGYSLCMQHVKTIMETGKIEIHESADEATKEFWNTLMTKLSCKCEQKAGE